MIKKNHEILAFEDGIHVVVSKEKKAHQFIFCHITLSWISLSKRLSLEHEGGFCLFVLCFLFLRKSLIIL